MRAFWSVLAVVGACAKAPPVESAVEAAPAVVRTVERPLVLWSVEKDGTRSHLLGTCHIGLGIETALPAPYDQLLTSARVLLTELDTTKLMSLDAFRAMWILEGPSLREQVGEDTFSELAYHLRDAMPASALAHLRPWGAYAVTLAGQMTDAPSGTAATEALDVVLERRAVESGVTRAHLETFAQQASMMQGMEPAIVASLRAREEIGAQQLAEWEAMSALCADGEVEPFEALLADPSYAELTASLLTTRNEAWIPTLLPHLAEGGAFVAVGAGHMVGERGLVALLQAEGYTVERLSGSVPADGWRPPAAPPDVARPAVDADRVAHWGELLASSLPGTVCVPGNPALDCFAPTKEACVAQVSADLALCVDQAAHDLPATDQPLDPALTQRIATCALTGMLLDVVARDVMPDAPQCEAVTQAITSAMP